MPWTTTFSGSEPGWRQLSTITDSNNGVDFVLRVNDQFPLHVKDDERSLRVIDTPLETP